MIEINLLPPEYKNKVNILAYLSDFLPYLVLAALIVLCINLVLGFFITERIVALKGVESRWKKQEPDYGEIAVLKDEVVKRKQEFDNLNSLVYPEIYFSEVMYLLSSNLLPNIWFREFSLADNVLNIQGTALDFEKDASLSLKEYVDLLKTTDIVKGFSQINIKSQEMRRIKDKGVLYFQLELRK